MSKSEFVDGQGLICGCKTKDCSCGGDEACIRTKTGQLLCACCLSDCPHVHPENGLKGLVRLTPPGK